MHITPHVQMGPEDLESIRWPVCGVIFFEDNCMGPFVASIEDVKARCKALSE